MWGEASNWTITECEEVARRKSNVKELHQSIVRGMPEWSRVVTE